MSQESLKDGKIYLILLRRFGIVWVRDQNDARNPIVLPIARLIIVISKPGMSYVHRGDILDYDLVIKDSPEGSSDPEFRSSILCGVIKIS